MLRWFMYLSRIFLRRNWKNGHWQRCSYVFDSIPQAKENTFGDKSEEFPSWEVRKIPKRLERMIHNIKIFLMEKKCLQMLKMMAKKLYIEMSNIILLLVIFVLHCFVDLSLLVFYKLRSSQTYKTMVVMIQTIYNLNKVQQNFFGG